MWRLGGLTKGADYEGLWQVHGARYRGYMGILGGLTK